MAGSRSLPGALARRLQHQLLPARRILSRVALVYEERHFREEAVTAVSVALAREAAKLRDELRALEERVILRVDIVLEELWRRTESAGARQATELQRLGSRIDTVALAAQTHAPDLARLVEQAGEVHRLAAEVAAARLGDLMPGGPSPVLAELREGAAVDVPAAQRWQTLLKRFEGLGPVVHAGDDHDTFVALAQQAGIDVAPGVAAASGLTRRRAGSLGGIFVTGGGAALGADAPALLGTVARLLQAGGLAVIESPNPDSFATYLRWLADESLPRPASAAALAAAAAAAGLELEEMADGPSPARRLGGVGTAQSEPAVREVAQAVNALVAHLNQVLYAPQHHILILHKP